MTTAVLDARPTADLRAPDRSSGRTYNGRRFVFRFVLALFILAIVASYAVPLWYQLQGDRLLVVTSGSMEPELRAGDAVVVRPVTSATQLRKGQVVTFVPLQSSQLVTHRIEALATVVRRDPDTDAVVFNSMGDPIKDAYVKTKGDANESADPGLTPASQVRGIVREVRPSLGWALWWAHSPFGRLMLFAPPLLMLVTAELLSRMPAQSRPWHHLARRRRHDARAQEQSHALD